MALYDQGNAISGFFTPPVSVFIYAEKFIADFSAPAYISTDRSNLWLYGCADMLTTFVAGDPDKVIMLLNPYIVLPKMISLMGIFTYAVSELLVSKLHTKLSAPVRSTLKFSVDVICKTIVPFGLFKSCEMSIIFFVVGVALI